MQKYETNRGELGEKCLFRVVSYAIQSCFFNRVFSAVIFQSCFINRVFPRLSKIGNARFGKLTPTITVNIHTRVVILYHENKRAFLYSTDDLRNIQSRIALRLGPAANTSFEIPRRHIDPTLITKTKTPARPQ
jgi:hypothetical protein